jgi:dihydrofolate reductase
VHQDDAGVHREESGVVGGGHRGVSVLQTLMKHDLVDAFWLKIFPVTLGSGKRLFAEGTIPGAFRVTESTVTSKGVIIVNYERAGAVQTGRV